MKPSKFALVAVLCVFSGTAFAEGLPAGVWKTKVSTKNPFTLTMNVSNGQVTIPDGKVGTSTATKVSTLKSTASSMVVKIEFTGGNCGKNSHGTLNLDKNNKGKWRGKWKGLCASRGVNFNASANAKPPAGS